MPTSAISGYKKFLAFLTTFAYLVYEHTILHKPAPELDKLLVAASGAYVAFESLKDAVVGFSRWWNVTHPGLSLPDSDPDIPRISPH